MPKGKTAQLCGSLWIENFTRSRPSDQPFAEFNLARDTAYTRLISMGVMDQEPTWTEILDSINSMLDREKV